MGTCGCGCKTFLVLPRFSQKIRTLQWADRRLGAAACFVATLWRRLGSWRQPPPPAGGYCSLIFIKLTEQGSTVLACEAVRAAIVRVGREHVHFLVFEENRFIVDALGLVPASNVHTVRTASAARMLHSCYQTLRAIRRLKIEACVDLEFFSRSSAVIAFLSGARWRAGFHADFGAGPYRGDLFTHRVAYNPQLHVSHSFHSLVRALDAEAMRLPVLDFVSGPHLAPPRFQCSPAEKPAMRERLRQLGVPLESRLILLNANAGDLLPLRKWAGRNYVALAQRLLGEFPEAHIAFTGSADEVAVIEDYVRAVASPRCLSLAGRTDLRELLVVYELAEVLVTNDSGPAHFAALTAIDVVVLFGPETPALFAAPGPRTHVIWAGIACSPCVSALNNRQTLCRDNVCMQRISLDEVTEKAAQIFRKRKAPAE